MEPVPGAGDELGRLADSLTRAEQLLVSRTTELITARDGALTATQAKNAFLSSTSHELRTPLNAVLGFAQLLQLSDLGQEDREAVERILAAGRHLLALINELIDIARIESGEFSLSVEPVAVAPVAEETCQLMAPLAADRSITISQDCPWAGLAVNADRQRLRQILVNLISNAIKYNRHGGTVTLTCQAVSSDQVSLAVADTGPGIPAADLDRIFDPFERLGEEQGAIEGTGIGLPLARAFAEAMKGHLTVASALGEGTTFTVTLPRAPDMAQAPQDRGMVSIPLPAPDGDGPAGTATRVLYIEDNPANIEVVARFMRTRPRIRLQSVMSGPAGLEVATQEIPDLILLDLHLPGLHGGEVLRRLRDKPATAGIPVAILSAEASPAIIRQMRARGVIAYLTKPLDLAELGELLDSFVAGRDHEGDPAPPAGTGIMNGVVLYIDDSQDNIFLLHRLFKRSCPDVQLHTAMTGRDGIKAAIDHQPALILLDNRLPDINGEQVLAELAAAPATAAIPVVILSGDSNPVTVNELLAAGAADFLVKPFDIHQLLAIIGRYLTDRRGPPPGPGGRAAVVRRASDRPADGSGGRAGGSRCCGCGEVPWRLVSCECGGFSCRAAVPAGTRGARASRRSGGHGRKLPGASPAVSDPGSPGREVTRTGQRPSVPGS